MYMYYGDVLEILTNCYTLRSYRGNVYVRTVGYETQVCRIIAVSPGSINRRKGTLCGGCRTWEHSLAIYGSTVD